MTALTDITALIDKQLEGVRERFNKRFKYQNSSWPDDALMLKTIALYQRLGKWEQHDPDCLSHGPNDNGSGQGECTCGLSAERDKIKQELEG